jgi:hypothetical protein
MLLRTATGCLLSGLMSAGSMVNGLFVLPIMTVMCALIGLGARRTLILALVSAAAFALGAVQNVVRKIFLDDVTFIAEANDEVVQPVMGVIPHNVPKDGVGADLDHWLWSYLSFFGQTRAHSPGKYHHFHGLWSQNEFFTAASKHCMLQIGKVNCGAW